MARLDWGNSDEAGWWDTFFDTVVLDYERAVRYGASRSWRYLWHDGVTMCYPRKLYYFKSDLPTARTQIRLYPKR